MLTVSILSVDEHGRQFSQTKTVKTTTSGKYEIEVPMVKNGYADIAVYSNEIWQYENRILGKNYLYNYDLNITKRLYFVNYTAQNYTYSQGTLVTEVE